MNFLAGTLSRVFVIFGKHIPRMESSRFFFFFSFITSATSPGTPSAITYTSLKFTCPFSFKSASSDWQCHEVRDWPVVDLHGLSKAAIGSIVTQPLLH
uniref:Uncharacterized protein n=1 Tax=Rhipicephalus zambeziensis TaxID=60191 RepID=A0A224YHQ9_9ACAR